MPIESIPLQEVDYAAVPQQDAEEEEEFSPPQRSAPTRLTASRSNTLSPWIAHALLALVNAFTFLYLVHRSPSEAVCRKLLDEPCKSWSK